MAIHTELRDRVLVVTIDDGDKNVLDADRLDVLADALAQDGDAVVLTGREGILTAGLDVGLLRRRDDARTLVAALGRCVMAWWVHPRPTVCAATGHALAAGTMLAMACDHAVAADTGAWGLLETTIDLEVPDFGIVLARANVRADRVDDLLLPGRRVDAATAADVGFVDEVTAADDVLDVAIEKARELAELPSRAYAGTKQRLRGAAAWEALDGLERDMDLLTRHLTDRTGAD